MTGYIYMFRNPDNDKCYIGKTINLKERIYRHKTITATKHTKFGCAIRKYGLDFFEFSILITIKRIDDRIVMTSILNNLEKYFIKKFNSYNCGYNLTAGGDGTENYVVSESTKKKISESHKLNMTPERLEYLRSRVSKIRRNYFTPEETARGRAKRQRKVMQLSLEGSPIQVYNSVVEAALATGTRRSDVNIIRVCKGQAKTANKFKWKYI